MTPQDDEQQPAGNLPTSVEEVIGEHKASRGGVLRAAIFGVNDGLISNTSLVMGVVGASVTHEVVLISGIAGLLAGAFSMAAGEYVSVRSQRDVFEHQIAAERHEIAANPEAEIEELTLIYADRGVPTRLAREVASHILSDPEKALDAMTREELGLNPDDLGSPWGAATYSFLSFSAGATVPLLPFVLGFGSMALPAAAALAGAALFAVGAGIGRMSRRGRLFGGLRMLLIGTLAGAATYGIGTLLGVAVG